MLGLDILHLLKHSKKKSKTIEDQEEKQIRTLEEHEKHLLKPSSETESLTLLKQIELVNERIDETKNLSKPIHFNNLVLLFQG